MIPVTQTRGLIALKNQSLTPISKRERGPKGFLTLFVSVFLSCIEKVDGYGRMFPKSLMDAYRLKIEEDKNGSN
jgi:hypothetical protein